MQSMSWFVLRPLFTVLRPSLRLHGFCFRHIDLSLSYDWGWLRLNRAYIILKVS
jgi:hypothetical protein